MTDAIKLAINALQAINPAFICDNAHHAKKDQHGYASECPIVARHEAALAALRAQPAEPLVFGMRGPKMTFTIGNQSFTLDYEPETTDEYVFMGNMLKAAIAKLPLGVKIGAQPDHSELVKRLRNFDFGSSDVDQWIEIMDEAADALEGKAIGAQPDHSEQHLGMVAAARAVVERWDTPLWKDAPATAGFINRLRDALPPAIGETME